MNKTVREVIAATEFPHWDMYAQTLDQADADLIIKALESAGFVIAPTEPTEAMLAAGRATMPIVDHSEQTYCAMIDALTT